MGVVYEAHDSAIDRKIAIKLMRADLLEGKERNDYVERFRREAQAAGRCNHPHIVAVYDFALHEDNPFLAMEYVDGLGLDRVLSHGERFAPDAAIHLILQVLDALHAAHAVGIVHRDIKPGNILLMRGGQVKVTDFGIARIDSSDLTHDGIAIGTPSYMSPEQCLGGPVDRRTDLFSAATVLQQMMTGERPFAGRNLTEIARALQDESPRGGTTLEALAGPAVRAVIHRALSKRPEDRYSSAELMAQALRQAMVSEPRQEDPSEFIDRTILAVRTLDAEAARGADPQFAPELLSGIERRLAFRVGPIARYLVDTTKRRVSSVEQLCDALAQRIDRPEERQRFLAEVREYTGGGSAPRLFRTGSSESSGLTPIPPEEAERCRRALAQALGPIAKILVERALPTVSNSQALWERLADHIDSERARTEFLSRRGSG
jgi:eukaryotic-like serine/threonine-protein kinase